MKPHYEVYFPNHPEEQFFTVAMCGKQVAEKGHSVPLRIYPNHNFSFILKGRGTFHSRFGDHTVTSGQGYFIEGGSAVSYEADTEDPWEYIFVNFRGEGFRELLKRAKISAEHPVFSYPMNMETQHILNELVKLSRENRSAGYDILGYFLILAESLLGKSITTSENMSARRLQDMVCYMESNCDRNITVQELSEQFFIDRSGIYRMFAREYGISPKEYILRCRLNKAAKRLREGNETITEIAMSGGFFDRAHFNRMFSDFFGMPPGEYRDFHQNNKN